MEQCSRESQSVRTRIESLLQAATEFERLMHSWLRTLTSAETKHIPVDTIRRCLLEHGESITSLIDQLATLERLTDSNTPSQTPVGTLLHSLQRQRLWTLWRSVLRPQDSRDGPGRIPSKK